MTPPTTKGGAWTETTLWNFGGFPGDGLAPSNLLMGSNGVLYGTTESGGAYFTPPAGGCSGILGGQNQRCEGTVFSLAPPTVAGGLWTETILWSFGTASFGGWPNGVIIGNGGVFYGTTQYGSVAGVLSTVFSLTPPAAPGGNWTQEALHGFLNTEPPWAGFAPYGNLLLGQDGALFGTTFAGGRSDYGTIFALRPPSSAGAAWKLVTLWNFEAGSGGQYPLGSLVRGNGGVLYGTTSGNYSLGGGAAVFSFVP